MGNNKGRFVKGHKAYWEGKKFPAGYKKKLSIAHKKLIAEGKNMPPSRKGIAPSNKGLKGFMAGEKNGNWKGGKPFCIDCGKRKICYVEGRCRECYLTSKGFTGIEMKLYSELENRGIFFEKQKLVNSRFIVDAFVPSLNLVIEADGDYWHSLDKVIKRDKAKNAYLLKCGFNLLRLSESEINTNLFKEKLYSYGIN